MFRAGRPCAFLSSRSLAPDRLARARRPGAKRRDAKFPSCTTQPYAIVLEVRQDLRGQKNGSVGESDRTDDANAQDSVAAQPALHLRWQSGWRAVVLRKWGFED